MKKKLPETNIEQKSPFGLFCDWTTVLCLPDYKAKLDASWLVWDILLGYRM